MGTSYTRDECILFCEAEGYEYAGMQFGSECWCSNEPGGYGYSDNCMSYCASDGAYGLCGGAYANTVYRTTQNQPCPEVAEVPSMECFEYNGEYYAYIRSYGNPDLCLSLAAWNPSNGEDLFMATCGTLGEGQYWRYDSSKNLIRSYWKYGPKCIDAEGPSDAAGTPLQM